MTSGWYYLNTNVTKNGRIESITGDVNLILGDGCTLDVKGLYVPAGSTLTIYGQSAGTGKIYSHPSGGAGIGGYSGHDNGDIVIHGGTIVANGYDHCAGIGSNDGHKGGAITIYGGTITAKGGSDGAAIGGGRNCDGGTITIYGGTITANGKTDSDTCENGAGIGGGDSAAGGTITINGGTITTYSRDGAGIGGGDDGDGGTITINGGTITSTKVNKGQGARIGGGCDGAPGTIIVNGGKVTTIGGSGAGIGGGKNNKGEGSVGIIGGVIESSGSYGIGSGAGGKDVNIILAYDDATKDSISVTASSFHGTVSLLNRFRNDNGNYEMGSINNLATLAGSALVAWDGKNGGIDYVDPSKGSQTYTGVYSTIDSNVTTLSDGWYAVSGQTKVKNEIAVSGTVNLVLKDGCKLSVPNIKVPAGSKLTIWGQSGGSGTIVAKADDETKAGIGGADCDCGTITINGGTIEATGGNSKDGCYGSAGIGGSYDCKPGTVIVNGGTVTATGGKSAAGIGSGAWVNNEGISAGKVEIRGGTVTARGKNGGAGIGSGLVYSWLETHVNFGTGRNGVNATGTIAITGGTVNAYGSEHTAVNSGNLATVMARGTAAAIGGGALSTAGTITISGGEVNAYAVKDGAAIGTGGFHGASRWTREGGTIKISGGTVNAVGYKGGDGAAIGGGFTCGAAKIEISGGTVTATGGCYAIGRGKGCDPACTTYLSWKDSTKDSMSVTADSYDTKLALMNVFRDSADGTAFPAVDPVNDPTQLAGRTLVPAPGMHTVTFDSDGAAKVAPQAVEDGACAQEPDKPSKDGYRFIGWRVVENKQMSPENFDFSTPITADMRLKAFYISMSERNGDHYTIETQGDAPMIDASNMDDVVSATLTKAELDAGYDLLLVSSPAAEADIPSDASAALKSRAKGLGATPGAWFDISLYKVLGEEQTKIPVAGTPVKLEVKVPASLQKDGRTFYLLSFHDGEASVLAEGTGATLEGETDRFSPYMIAYKDAAGNNPNSSSAKTATKTGDGMPIALLAMLALASGAMLLLAAKRRRDQ